MKYTGIIFDFDGTLCQTRPAIIASIQAAYQQLNQPIPTINHIKTKLGQGADLKNTLYLISPQATAAFIEELTQAYTSFYLNEGIRKIQLFPGAFQLLKTLKSANLTTMIVSNKLNEELQESVKHFQIIDNLSLVVGITSDSIAKPDRQLYDTKIAPVFPNLKNNPLLMVGDTLTDLKFAQAIQADACWVTYGEGTFESVQSFKPKYTIHNLSELLSIIF